VDHYLIPSPVPAHRMDYSQFWDHHTTSGADLSVGALPGGSGQDRKLWPDAASATPHP